MTTASRVIPIVAVLGTAALLVPAGAAWAVGDPSTTTVPSTTVPTTAPSPSPSTPVTTPTTTPVAMPTTPTIPANPNGERSALGADQTAAAQTELAGLTDGQRALLRQLQTARDALAVRRFALVALAREVATARERLDAARAAERDAQAKVDATQAQLRELKDEIVHLAAAAYRTHAQTRALGAIGSLDAGNAGALARAQTYARSDVALLGARVDSLSVLERRLETEQHSAATARAAAEAGTAELDDRLAAQVQAFADANDAATRAQTAVARGLGSAAGLVAQMLDPHFGADDITSVLAFVQAGQPEPPSLDAVFAVPVPGASLASPYGLRIDPFSGSIGYHPGLDFAADARTPIHAAAAGVVVIAGDCGGYGNCVVIDHGTSLATLYGHQSQLQVQVGDLVTAGQVIGLVGSTGISTGPHLHFEVRVHGAPIDPVPTLAG